MSVRILDSSTQFKQYYHLKEELGRGSYAVVYSCVSTADGKPYAVKVIDKSKAGESQLKDIEQEILLMQEITHDHIVFWKESMASPNTIFIVMELVRGGDLFKLVSMLQCYSEAIAATLLYNYLLALSYLHSKDVCHRDLKPDNVLLTHPLPKKKVNPEAQENMRLLTDIKLADFGFATKSSGDDMVKCCGTPYYIAPEILNTGLFKTSPGYGKQCDMWSTGVISYVLLSGFPPFQAQKRNQLFRLIQRGEYSFPANTIWDQISPAAKDFVSKLLVLDPAVRLTPEAALRHPWIVQHATQSHSNLPHVQERLVEFAARSKLKGAVFGVEAVHRMLYLSRCKHMNVKPNTGVLDELEDPLTSDTLDLSKNYLGKRGVGPAMELVKARPALRHLVLRGIDVENDAIDAIVEALMNHPGIVEVDLSNNPLSRTAAKKLTQLVQVNTHIKVINLEGTLIHPSKISAINTILQHNRVKNDSSFLSSTGATGGATASAAYAVVAAPATPLGFDTYLSSQARKYLL